MGSAKSKEITKHSKAAFTQQELTSLENYYFKLQLNKQQELTEKSFNFPENPNFAIKLFNWMKELCPQHKVDFTHFVVISELLLKDLKDYYLSDYQFRNLEKFELFSLISLECFETDKDQINRLQVSYSQGSIVICELLNIYHLNEITNSEKNDLAARSVTNAIFDQVDSLTFNQFIGGVKTQLIYANKLCKFYFNSKFLQLEIQNQQKNQEEIKEQQDQQNLEQNNNIKNQINHFNPLIIPTLSNSSFILNDQILALFQLSSPDFSKIKNLNCQFSSSVMDNDLDLITDIIINAKGPLLFIFRNREDESQNDTFQQQVFGAYISIDPTLETHYIRRKQKDPMGVLYSEDDPINLYFGDEKSFLFSLSPKYQLYMSTFDKNSKQCFAYLNQSNFNINQPYGLGFGGNSKGDHRIWIDQDIKTNGKNYINNNIDQTYENGYILEPHIKFLNLTCIEIWSIVKIEESIKQQQEEQKVQEKEEQYSEIQHIEQ